MEYLVLIENMQNGTLPRIQEKNVDLIDLGFWKKLRYPVDMSHGDFIKFFQRKLSNYYKLCP